MIHIQVVETVASEHFVLMISSKTQLITQNSGLQALSSKESAKNQCVINSVQLLIIQTIHVVIGVIESP